jgi:protein CMS1
MSSDESAAGVPLLEPLSRSPSPSGAVPGKRKREDKVASKKAKKQKRTKKPKDINEDDLDSALGVNLGIGRMDGQLLVDYVAQRTKRLKPKLSTVELEDLYLPGIYNMIRNTHKHMLRVFSECNS